MINNFLAQISREYLKKKNVFQYKGQKLSEMDDNDIIQYCHWYCEDNNLTDEWHIYRDEKEKALNFCPYHNEFIDPGLCCDMQMILTGYIKSTALSDLHIDSTELEKCCTECQHSL